MTERLVDVVNKHGNPVHTYPITLGEAAPEEDFEAKSLEAAVFGHLVPVDDLASLTTRMHISHGGPLQPYGDGLSCMSQTKSSLEQEVRVEANRLWMLSGEPENRSNHFWTKAHEEILRVRAYSLWQQEGSPLGRADEFWFRTLKFEQS